MILLIFGIYAMTTGRLQIAKHYGLRGTGARVAGAVCIACALGFFQIFSAPILALSKALELGDGGTVILGFAFQFVALIVVLVVLVSIYGNVYAKKAPPLPSSPGFGTTCPECSSVFPKPVEKCEFCGHRF